ncbi:MAG: hypothetical protein RLY31_751 [Bacteroidota bacterium]|jgi:hypothetical protein
MHGKTGNRILPKKQIIGPIYSLCDPFLTHNAGSQVPHSFPIRRKYRINKLERMNLQLQSAQLLLEKERLSAELDEKDKKITTDILHQGQ